MAALRPRAGAALLLAAACFGTATAAGASARALPATVDRVFDGDTIRVTVRGALETIRLVGIDTPEAWPRQECFGTHARRRASRLLPPGRRVVLRTDPKQDLRDRYGRLLAHVYVDGRRAADSVNRSLVRSGHARVYLYGDVRFRHAAAFEAAEQAARRALRGLWGPPCHGRA